jgi:hypothetical protein
LVPVLPLRPENRSIKLCIPIYFDDSVYPSAGAGADRKLIYWRTIAVLCASIRRASVPRLDILISTNEAPPSEISGVLDSFSVCFVSPHFSFQPPKDLYPAFSGAFYLFDCMRHCRSFSSENIFVFIDPDCLAMDNFERIRQLVRQRPLIGYDLELEEDEKVNGCSRNDLLAFIRLMADNSVDEPPRYFGGELLIVAGEELGNFCDFIDQVWKLNLTNFRTGKTTLKTEEHVLSVALARLADRVGLGNEIIKRMWTRPSFRNVSFEDEKFSIWHLPAEKRHAFQRLFALVKNNAKHLTALNDKEFRDLVSEMIRLNLSFVERPVYLLYPLLKKSAKRLIQLAPARSAKM